MRQQQQQWLYIGQLLIFFWVKGWPLVISIWSNSSTSEFVCVCECLSLFSILQPSPKGQLSPWGVLHRVKFADLKLSLSWSSHLFLLDTGMTMTTTNTELISTLLLWWRVSLPVLWGSSLSSRFKRANWNLSILSEQQSVGTVIVRQQQQLKFLTGSKRVVLLLQSFCCKILSVCWVYRCAGIVHNL